MSTNSLTPTPPKEVYELLQRTNKKKPAKQDVEAMRKALREHPGLWRHYGDLARLNQENLIHESTATPTMTKSLQRGMIEMREEMGFEQAPALERLLIEQVLLMWLDFHRVQYAYEKNLAISMPTKHRDYWERRLNAAQRRYLRAVETLARVRKLSKRGLVQINIAEQQQVNV